LPPLKEFTCRGLNGSVTSREDILLVKKIGLGRSETHELSVRRIRSVIVRRKSVVPMAAFTTLAAIATLVSRFNLLWFLVNLSAAEEFVGGATGLLATVLCAIPTISRALFVEIAISWGGESGSFVLRFVPQEQGKILVSRFRRSSARP
jgi:hypothetical protein